MLLLLLLLLLCNMYVNIFLTASEFGTCLAAVLFQQQRSGDEILVSMWIQSTPLGGKVARRRHYRTVGHMHAHAHTHGHPHTHAHGHAHTHTHLAQLQLKSGRNLSICLPPFSLVGGLQISDKEGKRITTTADEDTTSHSDSQPPGIFCTM